MKNDLILKQNKIKSGGVHCSVIP